MGKKIFLGIIFTLFSVMTLFRGVYAFDEYTVLRDIDKGTFNEYRYYMVREYFRLKEHFEVRGIVNKEIAETILGHAKIGYNYLPDSLINTNYFNDLKIAIEKSLASPNSEVYYEDFVRKLDTYIMKVNIQKLTGNIEATPISGNAPMTVTFRARVTDPSGTIIPSSNYVWWFNSAGVKRVIGRGQSINYTFKEEGNFSVFLDVKSNHKNQAGYTDVLSFSTRSVIEVKEKIASLIININNVPLREADEIKFTPDEANFGLIFDATSSTPTGGAKFRRTEWNFGNGVERKYDGDPKIERVVYSKEGNYSVSLKLTTNEGKTIERKFIIAIHKPIATIVTNRDDGYIGDRFTFSARSSINEKNLSFTWNIIDISNDKIIATRNGSVLNHVFSEKGRYNIQLQVKDAAGNQDTDTKIIYINSRAPVADFSFTIPDRAKPNRILLDGTKSYDPDFSDAGKLKYIWTINGEIVEIEALDSKGAIGHYTFENVGEHTVVLEVIDPDDMNAVKQQKVRIDSILSVDFFPLPRVIQRGGTVRFSVSSPNARYYEWDFGDGQQKQSASSTMQHSYEKSGIFTVKLTVRDIDGKTNQTTKVVYVSEANAPYAVVGVDFGTSEVPAFDASACSGGAYLVDRVRTVYFKGGESLNLDGSNNGLSYTWKIGHDRYMTTRDTSFKFSELGCFPIKLTVKSDKNGAVHSVDTWVKVENIKPTLSSLNISVQNEQADPVLVTVSAVGAQDPDGVIQSYLWYYYTDTDTDPQDFRITSQPNTTFVIPKISGNYYFVVVMRDNNDERFSSEDATSNKYFISLTGDNINTPLIDFKVNKNNVLIGEEVSFSAKVRNILGQDITSTSEFAWDFDGDGFYDKESNTGEMTHKYESSGTFYAKVRVKNKGMTNVRTIEINVANVLEPDFEYTSIGDTFIFFNTSGGKYDKVSWDMGDGTIIEERNNFSYTYEDGKSTHTVVLKISEGTKVKTKTKTVNRDLREMINQRNAKDIYVLSNQEIKDNAIILTQEGQKVILYIGKQTGAENYALDFDIEIDTDLNGTKDDDIDNQNDPSFSGAGMIEIPLNDKKIQTIRIFTLDRSGNTLDARDIKITKNYIKDEEIDMDTIIFNGVTDSERFKIEKLKSYIQGLPQEHRLKGMQYIQKLQEEWFYVNEKTKIILEFEAFIDSLGVSNGTDIINLLESFLIEGQEDQSLRNMAYNVVKNLIPKELVEYDEIVANLDQIKENPDKLEENKVLGREILEMIKDTSLISNEDKLTIKTQLQVFIYGSVENIPEEIIKEVKTQDKDGNKIIGLLSSLVNIIGILFGAVFFIILGFFAWFKISNKNKNQGLQDFIIEKTSGQTQDILGDFEEPAKKAAEVSITREPKVEPKETTPIEKKPIDPLSSTGGTEEQVPDWLKGAMSTEAPKETPKVAEIPEVETKVEEEQVPDWLKGAIGKESKEETPPVVPTPEETVVETPKVTETPEVETKVEEEQVPDWLKGAIGKESKEETPPVVPTPEETVVETPKVAETPEVETKVEEEQVPDWLKGVIDQDKIVSPEETPKKEEKKEKPQAVADTLLETTPPTSTQKPKTKKISEEKEEKAKKEEKKTSKKISEKKQELWDDGMDVPDWLKEPKTKSPPPTKDDFWTLDNALPDDDNTNKK